MSNAALSWARAQRGMTPCERLVLMILADCAREDTAMAWPSQQAIAEETGMPRPSVSRVIKRLAVLGKIEVGGHPNRRSYRLAVPTCDDRAVTTGDDSVPPCYVNVPTGDATVTSGYPNPKEPSRTQSPPPIPPRKRVGMLDGFEDWWRDYPHKVGKGAAERAWPKALALAKGVDLAAAVRRYIEGKPADRPWCNPATWLNQRRWEDQEAGSLNGTSHGPQGPPPKPEELWPDLMNGERLH